MRCFLVALVVMLVVSTPGPARALSAHPAPAPAPASPASASATGPAAPDAATQNALNGAAQASPSTPSNAPESERILGELAAAETRLDERIASLKPDPSAKWMPGLFVLLGALIAATAGYLTQRAKLGADERLSRRSSGRTAIADLMEFRSRQLNEFYAPLRALQGQGLAIRNQLYDQLLANPSGAYTFFKQPDPKAANGWSLWYKHAGTDKPFRMIDDLPLLYQQAPQLMPMIDQIIATGDATSTLIREHGGLALPENTELTEMLGAFLAHHAIFKHLRDTVATPSTVKYTAIYPRGFDKVIKQDFETLVKELREWSNSAKALAAS